ncbi:MAG: 1,2-phenylacetyl-CoA epoxidase subunit PaaC [Pseudomonadota bacterium]
MTLAPASATDTDSASFRFTLGLADDALVLGHRLSEWSSRGPYLEEDIALTNVALDHVGRARLFYQYAATQSNGRSEDDLAFLRDARDFRNHLLFELSRGDFATTIVRQFLADVYHAHYFRQLQHSSDATLAAVAEKACVEVQYHQRHSSEWLLKLGDGTEESHKRTQSALDELWGFTVELFEIDDAGAQLIGDGVAIDPAAFRLEWQREVAAVIERATLQLPEVDWAVRGGRAGYHTEHLGHLLTEMQSVHRAYPGCTW